MAELLAEQEKAFPKLAAALLARMRKERPRIHAITNNAAQVFTANLILAAGGIPSLTFSADEVPAFVARSQALLINLGTLDQERRNAIPRAIETAQAKHIPFVLDPVFVEASDGRLAFARKCLAADPSVLRCNRAEFQALTQSTSQDVADAARSFGTVVALTGETDEISDGQQRIQIHNGHRLMALTTAMGCAATALIAGFSALHEDRFTAAACALLVTGIAGEIAGQKALGPGSFPAIFLDVLYGLDEATLGKHASWT